MADTEPTMAVTPSLLEYLHRCPLCAHDRLDHYCRVPSLFAANEYIRYERCRCCDGVFRNPRLPPDLRHANYRDKPKSATRLELDGKSQAHYAYMMQRIARHLRGPPQCPRLLDFGCGAGGFLLEAREAGFEVMGLELGEELADHVRKTHHIPVHSGLVGDAAFCSEQFDVIVSSQVFEHLVDPRGTLRELASHLVGDALLLIEVPNLRDSRERLKRGSTMDDSHLFYFSRKSLSRLLEQEGFRVVEVEEGVRPWRFLDAARLRGASTAWLHGLERGLSALGLRTSLSVLARLERPPPIRLRAAGARNREGR